VIWKAKVAELTHLLETTETSDAGGASIAADEAVARWVSQTVALREADRSTFFAGNGASASMASHFSADLAKNAHVRTEVFTDPALVTAVGNDLGYDQVFAEPLRRRARPGDQLVTISSSGRSPNILGAIAVAREQGVFIVTLSAMDPTNPSRAGGDLNFYVPAKTYGGAETSHAAILHHWMDAMVEG
jgi:D-sedoheptulose 7-phosphate isomerase